MVREFQDVFRRDLSSVSLDRDIDFSICLKRSSKSILIPPYRMSLAKLKELKDHLQDLLSKDSLDPMFHLGMFLCCL